MYLLEPPFLKSWIRHCACMLIRHSGLEQQTNRRCQEEANNPVDHVLHALDM